MRICIGANDASSIANATDWLANERLLFELQEWVRSREGEWGEAYIFIEITLPIQTARNNRNQIDLLICFTERGALCELKRHTSLRNIRVRDLSEQAKGQEETFRILLRSGGFAGDYSQILFFPSLDASSLMLIRRDLASVYSKSHLQVTGSLEELRSPAADGIIYHLLPVLEKSLDTRLVTSQMGAGLQLYLHSILTAGNRHLYVYSNARDALTSLKTFVPAPHVRLPECYVPGCRPAELAFASQCLANDHLVELCGPPGIGKSVLAMELIRHLNIPYLDFEVRNSSTLEALCRGIEERLEGTPNRLLAASMLPSRLADETLVYWVREYDDQSHSALHLLMDALRCLKPKGRAYWIFESLAALNRSGGALVVDVGGMIRAKIAQILFKLPQGGLTSDREVAIDNAFGNPRSAICAWTGKSQPPHGSFSWFVAQLSAEARRILRVLCYAMTKAPLGLSGGLAERFIAQACRALPVSVAAAATSEVLTALENEQLANISRFSRQKFGGLLDDIIPPRGELLFIDSIHAGLCAAVIKQIDPGALANLKIALEAVLIESAEPGNLAEVTYEILAGDLEPFFRSSFRFTSLGRVVLEWMDAAGWEAPSRRQEYLSRGLRVLTSLNRDRSTDVSADLGEPDPADTVQCFARDFVLARQMTVLPLRDGFDLAKWRSEIGRIPDPDLQAVLYTSCVTALQNEGKSQNAWEMLWESSERFPKMSNAWVTVQFHIANFINTKEGRAVAGDGASKLTAASSGSLVEAGLLFQNIHLICEGLFYYARGAEFVLGRTDFSKVLAYRTALDWIENVPGARARWRLRILLTRGSIHRHFLRQDGLPWSEFAVHLELALADYSRAFQSAYGMRHVLHALNAASYTSQLCRFALRYGNSPEAHQLITRVAEVAADQCHLIRQDIYPKGPKEREIFANIERAETVIEYVARIATGRMISQGPAVLRNTWSLYADLICERRRANWAAGKDPADEALTDVFRAFQFGEAIMPSDHKQFVSIVESEIERLLHSTGPRRVGARPPRSWEKLRQLMTTYRAARTATSSL